MAAGGDSFSTKIHSSLVSSYPKPFDIRHDIFVPGNSTKFRQQLRAALSTRGFLRHLEEAAPTAQDIATANPAASGAEVLEALQEALDMRQTAHNTAAAQLPETLKSESLNLQERTTLASQKIPDGSSDAPEAATPPLCSVREPAVLHATATQRHTHRRTATATDTLEYRRLLACLGPRLHLAVCQRPQRVPLCLGDVSHPLPWPMLAERVTGGVPGGITLA